MFSNNKNELRQVYLNCWQLKKNKQALDPMQQVVATIVELHPEYHDLLEDKNSVNQDFSAEQGQSNPFLHMSMHIALHEQISTNRPQGIKENFQRLCTKHGDVHQVEHVMMECLAQALWNAQRNQSQPDEASYLACLKKL